MDQKDKRLHYILPKRNSNSHDGETSYVPSGRWTDKENVMFSWNEILSRHKKEWNPAIFYDIDGLWVYYAKWNKLEKDTYYMTHLNMEPKNSRLLEIGSKESFSGHYCFYVRVYELLTLVTPSDEKELNHFVFTIPS